MTEIKDRLRELIENKQWKTIRKEITEYDFVHIADIIDDLSDQDDIIVFRLLPRELAKNTFQYLSHYKKEQIIEKLAINAKKLADLLNDLDPDDRTAFFEELPGQVAQRLIQLLSPEERSIATRLLGYPEESIGRLMTPEYVAVKPFFTIAQTLEHIRTYGKDKETFNIIYVVDENWKLIDDIRIREILFANPEQTIEEISDKRFIALSAFDDQESAVRVFQDHDRVALPVVNSEGTLIGIVTVDDMMDVVEEETTEDFHRFGAFQGAIVNPMKASVMFLYQKRILWLSVLVFMNVFSGAAIASYENTIKSMVSLMFFLPLLIGSAGNAGSQSATLMIRALATGEVLVKDWFKLISKEILVSFLLGITMAIAVSMIAFLRAHEIIIVVCSTMILTVMAGSLIGLMLPFIFTKLKLDPATASAPLITSIADILGVLIYFSIATWYLNI